nr:CYP361B1 protein [Diaphanosoma celebensis]
MAELELLSVRAALVSLFGIVLSLWIVQRKRALGYLQTFGIPCPPSHFVYGNLHQLRWSKDKNVLEMQQEWLDRYGKIVGYYMGLKPRIIVADLDAAKRILVKDINIFTNRPDVPRGLPTLLSLRDQRWKDIRHILTPTFSSLKLKLMMPLVGQCVDEMMDILQEKSCNVLDIYETFQGLTLDVISRCALALRLDCQGNPNHEILVAVRNLFRLDLSRIVVLLVCFPGLRAVFRMLFRFAPSHKLIKFVLGHLKSVIQQRRNQKEDPVLVDALHLLLEASEGDRKGPALLNDDEIIWNAYVFLLAGYETTSTALSYVCHCLSLHPDVQERIFEELKSLERPLKYEDMAELRYLELVILESMRLYPPVPLFVSRECKETVTIDDLTIPEGSTVDVPVWCIHRDPELWPDPLTFDPYRHSNEMKADRHPMAFLPFGSGPRNCIGARFAMLEMKMALARLLRQFRVLPCSQTQDPLPTVVRTTIMNPLDGVWVKLEPRVQ